MAVPTISLYPEVPDAGEISTSFKSLSSLLFSVWWMVKADTELSDQSESIVRRSRLSCPSPPVYATAFVSINPGIS